MGLQWNDLTKAQQVVLNFLAGRGRPSGIPPELSEQLLCLGLIEPVSGDLFSLSQYGATVLPATLH